MDQTPEIFSLIVSRNSSGRFSPGDIISGYVLKLSPRTQTKNVNITCRGKAVASLNEQDLDSSSSYRQSMSRSLSLFLLPATWKDEYFLHSSVCLDEHITIYDEDEQEENNDDDSSIRPPLLFLFQLRLPKVLPPSCELRYGVISYDLKFEWDVWKGDDLLGGWERGEKIIPITVAASVNLNEIPFAGEPAEASRHQKLSFLCFNFGNADVSLAIDKVGYIPGEELRFKVKATNETKFDVNKITVCLRQERTFCVGELKRKFNKVLATCDGPGLPRGEDITWEDYLIVPDVQLKFFWPSSLIRVAFFLQVRLTTNKVRCSTQETIVDTSVSVIIGDIPVDPVAYMRNFGVTMGAYELGSSEYEPERMWLGIDCLTDWVNVPMISNLVDEPNRHDDRTPSYSSVVGAASHNRRKLESPPPSYNEAVEMFKPEKLIGKHPERTADQGE